MWGSRQEFGKGVGSSAKGVGKGQALLEARGCTMFFGEFPENTPLGDIASLIDEGDKVDENGAYFHGQPIATSGAVLT